MAVKRPGLNRAALRRAGAGAGDGITAITSTGGSVVITNPNGPTTNLEVAAAAADDFANVYAAGAAAADQTASLRTADGGGMVIDGSSAVNWNGAQPALTIKGNTNLGAQPPLRLTGGNGSNGGLTMDTGAGNVTCSDAGLQLTGFSGFTLIGGSATGVVGDAAGNVAIGLASAQLAAAAVSGFAGIPSLAGMPTGAPTGGSFTGAPFSTPVGWDASISGKKAYAWDGTSAGWNAIGSVATWPIANTRFYALDTGAGNDGHAGFSDVSSAAAGAVAKATLTGLSAIIPRIGYGRTITIFIRSGSYVGQGDPGQLLLASLIGYSSVKIIATDTVVSAGATAFLGDGPDRICAGMTTATGMNAAGYNPIGALSATLLQLQKAGGGAAGFPAEPAIPLWCRLRFDVATTTATLRNVARWVRVVSGTDTITPLSAFPAVPAGTDVAYLEMPNVVTDLWNVSAPVQLTRTAAVLVGMRSAGTLQYSGAGQLNLCGCLFGNISTPEFQGDTSPDVTYFDGSSRVVGMGVRVEGVCTFSSKYGPVGTAPALGVAQSITFNPCDYLVWSNGSAAFGGINVQNSQGATGNPDNQTLTSLGARSHNAEPACRVRGVVTGGGIGVGGTGVAIRFSSLTIDALDISAMPAGAPAMTLIGRCAISVSSFLTSTGAANPDVGLDLLLSVGSLIYIVSAPTCTGALGDVRLADGTIVSWATAALGLVDKNGNRFIGPGQVGGTPGKTVNPTGALNFSGTLIGGAGASTSFLANGGIIGAVNQTTAHQWPTSNRMMMRLRVNVIANTATTVLTIELYKNGVATGQKVTYNAAVTGKTVDSAHPIFFTDTDDFDVKVTNTGADAGAVTTLSAMLEYAV